MKPKLTLTKRLAFPRALVALIALFGMLQISRAATVLYATGSGVTALSGLWQINPATGQATLLHQFPGVYIYQSGLAYDPGTDKMYATGVLDSSPATSRLFIIDRFAGTISNFATLTQANFNAGGLALHPVTGELYATGNIGHQSTALFRINKNTGAETYLGTNGPACCVEPYAFQMSGLGFRSDGTLFANGSVGAGGTGSSLYTIPILGPTAQAVLVGPHNVAFTLQNSGLAFATNGTLYSLGSISASATGLYTVSTATGAATLVGPTLAGMGAGGGLAFAPDTPQLQRAALSIAATATNTLVLSWPTNATFSHPYVLHQNSSFNANSWTVVTNAPVFSSGSNQVVLPFPPTQRLYRLQTL